MEVYDALFKYKKKGPVREIKEKDTKKNCIKNKEISGQKREEEEEERERESGRN